MATSTVFPRRTFVLCALACAATVYGAPLEPGMELTLKHAIEVALQNHPARLAAASRE